MTSRMNISRTKIVFDRFLLRTQDPLFHFSEHHVFIPFSGQKTLRLPPRTYANCCHQLILPRPFGHLLNNRCLQMIPPIFFSFLMISISTMLNNFTTFLGTQVQISCLLCLRVFDVTLPQILLVGFLLYLLALFHSYYFVHMAVLFSVNYCIFFAKLFCVVSRVIIMSLWFSQGLIITSFISYFLMGSCGGRKIQAHFHLV